MGTYEILEHTADVGLRARGATLEEVFATATEGMMAIAGTWQPDSSSRSAGAVEEVPLEVDGGDLAGLLVEWLGEALYVQDSRSDGVAGVRVDSVETSRATGALLVRPFAGDPSEGVQIKAVTYHQLAVDGADGDWTATVFFDI